MMHLSRQFHPFLAAAFLFILSHDIGLAAENMARPIFSTDNSGATVFQGSKSLTLLRGFGQLDLILDTDVKCHGEVMQDFGQGAIGTVFFMDKNIKTQDNEAIFTAKPRAQSSSKTPLGSFSFRMILQPDGWIRLTSATEINKDAPPAKQYFFLRLPEFAPLAGSINSGGKIVALADNSNLAVSEEDFTKTVIDLYPDTPGLHFKIELNEGTTASVNKRLLTLRPRNGILKFRINLAGEASRQRSKHFYNGVDFWNLDQLCLPDYKSRRNLLPNPSFEAGLHYYGFPMWGRRPWKESPRQVVYNIDASQAKFGAHSLQLIADKEKAAMPLGTFAIPLEQGEKYTLSFYAKGDLEKGLQVNVSGRGLLYYLWKQHGKPQAWVNFQIDQQWKRYSFAFNAEVIFAACLYFEGLLAANSPAQEGRIWIDGIQLEKGGQATEYVEPPVSAQLVSAARGNFLAFNQAPDFQLKIYARPQEQITAKLNVKDFFGREIFQKTLDLKTDQNGNAAIPLPDLSRTILEGKWRGVFVVACEFSSSAFAEPFSDYFRFSVMNFLENTHKNKAIFLHGYQTTPHIQGLLMDLFLERERAIGIGGCCRIVPDDCSLAVDKQRSALVAKYGIEQFDRPVVVDRHGGNGKITADDGRISMDNIINRTNATEEELKVFENICALKAKMSPWVTQWYFAAECNPGLRPLSDDLDSFGKFLLATLRGIKKGNPAAQVLITGGPWNMAPTLGTKWLESYIQKTKELDPTAHFDGCGIHVYRDMPENPDLDYDTSKLLEMLDRNGVGHWPIYWNEALNIFEYNLPPIGASPYQGNSVKNFHGLLSYDMGNAEKIAAALRARSWLVALKYQDRVKVMHDLGGEYRMYLDHDFTAGAGQKISNTLGRFLGNAGFYKDIRFAPQCRGYIFIDEKDRPVAVLWGHNELVDRWKQAAPEFSFDLRRCEARIFDLMETERDYPRTEDGRTILPMGSFPIFVIGRPGSKDALCAAIDAAKPVSGKLQTVSVNAYPTLTNGVQVVFNNLVSKKFEGKAQLSVNGAKSPRDILLAPSEQKTATLPLGISPDSYGKLLPFQFECALNEETVKISAFYAILNARAGAGIEIDGDSRDWENVPAMPLGQNTTVQLVIANHTLYLCLKQKTANSAAKPENAFVGLGLFVDPIESINTWSQPKPTTGNIFVYEFQKSPEAGKLEIYRWTAPSVQEDSGSGPRSREFEKKALCRRTIRNNEVFLEAAFPQYSLMPLRLETDACFGFNLLLPDEKGNPVSLLPVKNFQGLKQPCDVNFIMSLIK